MSCIGAGKHTKHNNNSKGNLHTQHDNNMPSASTAKFAETTVYDAIRVNPFTQIHGRPTRNNYETLKKEASDLASKVKDITYDWAQDTNTGNEYGLFAEIIGKPELLALCLTTKPLRRRNGLVVKHNANKSAVLGSIP
jgi:hypothetical protein